MFLKQIPRKR